MRISIGTDFSDRYLRTDNFLHIPSIRYAKNIHYFTQGITNNTAIDIISICIEAVSNRLFLSNTPTNIIIPYNTRELWKIDRSFEIAKLSGMSDYTFPGADPTNQIFTSALQNEFGIYNYYSLVKSTEKHTVTIILGGHQQKSQQEIELIKKHTQPKVDKFLINIIKGLRAIIIEQMPALKYSQFTRNDHYLHDLIYQKRTPAFPKLRPYELECLFWYQEGKSAQEIAKITGYQISTIYSYLRDIREKLNVTSNRDKKPITI